MTTPPALSHSSTIRVRYAETDQMGVVHHANYLVWMEVARVEFCAALGFRYRDMEREDGVLIAVVETNTRHLRPAHFDDEVTITATVAQANSRMMTFAYRIARGPELLASGQTKHIFVDSAMHPVRLPVKYRERFGIR